MMKQLTILYLIRDGQILMAMKKRGFTVGRWNGVGGKVEAGETVEAAMIRESQEEINVTPTEYTTAAILEFDEITGTGNREVVEIHIFIASQWKGEPTESQEMAPQWFDQANIPFEQMWEVDRLWLPKILQGKKLTGRYTLDDDDQVVEQDIHEVVSLP